MNFYYKCKISYLGTRYKGWQIQAQGERTIQGEILEVLFKLCGGKNETSKETIKIVASGRTDAGVHAFGQVLRISLEKRFDPQQLRKSLNSLLPDDIFVETIDLCEESFHPIFSAKNKSYTYLACFEKSHLKPFLNNTITFYPPYELNRELIYKALEYLIGEHDFVHFSTKGTPVKTTIRTIYKASMKEETLTYLSFDQKITVLKFEFQGSGFLKQMVRLLVGCLIDIGRDKITLEQFQELLKGKKDFNQNFPVAPAQGLYLEEVVY